MSPQPRPDACRTRPLRCAIAVSLAFASLPAGAQDTLPTASTVEAAVARTWDLPVAPLADTLARIARDSGQRLSADPALITGKTAAAVHGRLSPADAARRALAGTGLELVVTDSGTLSLRPAPAKTHDAETTLAPVTVTAGTQQESAWGAVQGYIARRSASGSKTDSAIADIPQSISIISAQQMADQGVQSITTALGYTPGVVGQYGDNDLRHDWLTVRGFTPARYLDGLRLPYGARGYAQPRIEPYGLERVEVLKGPASVLYGQAAPGGLINMVRKRPTEEATREIQVKLGSHEQRQVGLDIGGPVDEQGTVAYRVVSLVRDSDTQFDHVEERKRYIAPSLSIQASDTTRLTLLAEYQKIESPGGGGAPALPSNGTLDTSTYARLARNTFVGEPGYDNFSNEQWSIGYELEHRLSNHWRLRQNLRYAEVDTDTQRVQAACASSATCNPSALFRYAWAFPETSKLLTVDNQAVANFDAGGIQHTVLLGVDYSREKSAFEESQLVFLSSLFNAYNPTYGTAVSRPGPAMLIDQRLTQTGLYAQDQMQIGKLALTVSGRYDRADTDTLTRMVTAGTSTRVKQKDRELTGRLGAVYGFDNGVSPYASISTSFQPAGGTDRNGTPFDPTTGQQIEIGVKIQPKNIRALLTLAAYQLAQENVLTPDPVNTSFRVQSGEARVRGFEAEGKFELSEQLALIASYAYTDSEITKDNPNSAGVSNQGNQLAFVPRHQAALWADYRFGAELTGFSVGGGVRYTGRTWGNNANTTDIPGYSIADLALRYDFGQRHSSLQGVSLALNINNLFDKRYVSTCLSTTTSCYWGDERRITGTLSYRW